MTFSLFSLAHCVQSFGITALVLVVSPATAAPVIWPPGWVVSSDGATVLDERSGLVWARCVEGMKWNGKTCVGQPTLLDRAGAAAAATSRGRREAVGWRLPRAAELQRLVDKSTQPAALNPLLFPSGPGDWHWSATSNTHAPAINRYNYQNIMREQHGDSQNAQAAMLLGWAVNLSTGEARGDAARSSKLPVRLVRAYP